MHACHLCEDVLSGDRLIGWYGYSAVALHQSGDLIEAAFVYGGVCLELVLQYRLNTGQRRISGTLTQSIHTGMYSPGTTQHGGQHIADGQVIVIVRMEVKMEMGEMLYHLPHVADKVKWIQYAKGVGQHEPLYAVSLQGLYQCKHILGAVLHAVAPVLQIYVDRETLLRSIFHGADDILSVLLHGLLQLSFAMLPGTLAQQVDTLAPALGYPVHAGVSVHESQHFHPRELPSLSGPSADTLYSLHLSFGDTGRSHLYAVHIEVLQECSRNDQLLMGHKTHSAGLFAIAECGIHYLYALHFWVSSHSQWGSNCVQR